MSTENTIGTIFATIFVITVIVLVSSTLRTPRDTPRERHCIETLSELFNGFDVAPSVCNDILYSPIK